MNNFTGQSVLVTGGTGSVAKAVAKKLLAMEGGRPKHIRIFSRDEAKQYDMQVSGEFHSPVTTVEFVVGDVRDKYSVREATKDIDIIFHCAAMKHVPVCEQNVKEACLTNINGAMNVADAALERDQVKAVVVCSTDKACSPTTVMGASKLLQERIILNSGPKGKFIRFMCVRFGNLLESRGSVFHLFYKGRETGKIWLTHPEMTRFVSTLDEAAETMIYAANNGNNGDVIIRDCPAIKMKLMAEVLAPDAEISIVGVRKNERIHELLYNESEAMRVKKADGHFIINANREPSDDNEMYSSADKCISDEETAELVKEFAKRCGYEV